MFLFIYLNTVAKGTVMYLRCFYGSVEQSFFLDPVLKNYNKIMYYETQRMMGCRLWTNRMCRFVLISRFAGAPRNQQETTVLNILCLIYIVDHHLGLTLCSALLSDLLLKTFGHSVQAVSHPKLACCLTANFTVLHFTRYL